MQEPPQLQLLRDHWQAVVVDRLMRVAQRSGEPLARRARNPEELARLRAADVASSCVGDGQPSFNGDGGPAAHAAHRIGRQGSLEPPPLGKPPVDTPVISMPLLNRAISAAVRGDGQVPDCEKPGNAVRCQPLLISLFYMMHSAEFQVNITPHETLSFLGAGETMHSSRKYVTQHRWYLWQ